MVHQAFEFCKTLGLSSVMVTCGDENVPSFQLIEKLGGQLEDRTWDDEDKELIRRYWIALSESL